MSFVFRSSTVIARVRKRGYKTLLMIFNASMRQLNRGSDMHDTLQGMCLVATKSLRLISHNIRCGVKLSLAYPRQKQKVLIGFCIGRRQPQQLPDIRCFNRGYII